MTFGILKGDSKKPYKQNLVVVTLYRPYVCVIFQIM